MTPLASPTLVALRILGKRDDIFSLAIAGRLDSDTTGKIWRQATETIAAAKARSVIVDASQIDYCDGSGISFFCHPRNLQPKARGQLEVHVLRLELQ